MDELIDLPRPSRLRPSPKRLKVATPQGPRCFHLVRYRDVTGVSGTGVVAEGVEWSDGTVALRWSSKYPTTTVWQDGIEALIAVHGHGGASTIHWLDEQAPGSVGGAP
jgi:hypothetical protein